MKWIEDQLSGAKAAVRNANAKSIQLYKNIIHSNKELKENED